MHRYKKLDIWKLSKKLCLEIYRICIKFPSDEKFVLSNQLRKAAISVPSNIAEGCSRSSTKEFKRFLEIAKGSLFEIDTQLHIALELQYINQISFNHLNDLVQKLLKMTYGFLVSLRDK